MEIASFAEARICVRGPIRTEKREQALTALIESHRARLLSIIRNRIRDQVEAEDVLQDVFAEFVEAYDLGQAIEALGAWLVRVAQNKILDRFSQAKDSEQLRGFGSGYGKGRATVSQPPRRRMDARMAPSGNCQCSGNAPKRAA
jgi:DNA-directed RNA polymerase specialized sigma24 family protein